TSSTSAHDWAPLGSLPTCESAEQSVDRLRRGDMPILVAQFDPAARRPDHAYQQQANQAQACGAMVETGTEYRRGGLERAFDQLTGGAGGGRDLLARLGEAPVLGHADAHDLGAFQHALTQKVQHRDDTPVG